PARPVSAGLGTVPVREEAPAAPAEPAPAVEAAVPAVTPPSIPTTRPYPDSQAEELDVPDFLK
ncbi:cell division protein FtsZ, partial [Streptomyces sp. NPDC052644]